MQMDVAMGRDADTDMDMIMDMEATEFPEDTEMPDTMMPSNMTMYPDGTTGAPTETRMPMSPGAAPLSGTTTTPTISASRSLATCSICEDGLGAAMYPSRSFLGPLGVKASCQDIETTVLAPQDPNTCDYDGTYFGVDLRYFCGCANAEYPSVCEGICPGGDPVTDDSIEFK